jgi:uncharacterized protein DUF4189
MNRIAWLPIVILALVAALVPRSVATADDCYSRCAFALGGQDVVSASIYDNCINRCRAGAGQQGPVDRYAAIAFSNSNARAGASHGQTSESAAKELALTHCRQNEGSACHLLNWGSNLCFGLATSEPDHSYGHDFDADRTRAAAKALAKCRGTGAKNCSVLTTPCANDDPRWSSPLPLPPAPAGVAARVDRKTVGTWELLINPGYWIWEIGPQGTYEFHSQAIDNAPSHSGTLVAVDGHWTLQAGNGYSDGGTYKFQSPDTLVATGKLGTGVWHRSAK